MNRVLTTLIGLVAVAAGVLAWDATTTTAQATHAVTPNLAWLVPLILEAGCVVLGFRAFVIARREGQRALTERAAVIALFALSLVVQVAHARSEGANLLGQVLAAAPVVVLVLTVESLLRGAHTEPESDEEETTAGNPDNSAAPGEPPAVVAATAKATRGGREALTNEPTQGECSESAIHLVEPTPEPEVRVPAAQPARTRIDTSRTSTKRDDRAQVLAELRAEHGDTLNGTHVAQALGVSPSQGRRILAAHKTKEAA